MRENGEECLAESARAVAPLNSDFCGIWLLLGDFDLVGPGGSLGGFKKSTARSIMTRSLVLNYGD
jgi:hypothetical protein